MKHTRLQKLLEQRQQIEARIKKAESAHKAIAKKKETRQKILLGALLKEWMSHDAQIDQRVWQALPEFLVRPVDRQVFDLENQQSQDAT